MPYLLHHTSGNRWDVALSAAWLTGAQHADCTKLLKGQELSVLSLKILILNHHLRHYVITSSVTVKHLTMQISLQHYLIDSFCSFGKLKTVLKSMLHTPINRNLNYKDSVKIIRTFRRTANQKLRIIHKCEYSWGPAIPPAGCRGHCGDTQIIHKVRFMCINRSYRFFYIFGVSGPIETLLRF